MFTSPDVLQAAQDMARHAATRQSLTARNAANADTPGYRAQDMADFSATFEQAHSTASLKRTRAAHQSAASPLGTPRTQFTDDPADPNGNTVSLERELVRAAQAKSAHDTALTLYRTSLDIMRTALGRGR